MIAVWQMEVIARVLFLDDDRQGLARISSGLALH
jgi:hypothetical protein